MASIVWIFRGDSSALISGVQNVGQACQQLLTRHLLCSDGRWQLPMSLLDKADGAW